MKSFLPGALFAAAILGGALVSSDTAEATTFQVTYTGTVYSGYDTTGVFGTAGTDLTGQSFSATYVFDTALGYYQPGATTNYLYGGPAYPGYSNPLLSASLTVGSSTVAIPFNYYGYVQQGLGASGVYEYYVETSQGIGASYGYVRITSLNNNTFGGPNIYSPFTYVYDPAEDTRGGYVGFGALGSQAYVYLNPADVTVGPASEVPLPAALPLFASALIGGSIVGWRKRRRQKAEALAA